MSVKLLGIYAPAPGSGKTTVARILQNQGNWQVVSFATPLKRMVASFLNSAGYGHEQISDLMTHDKEDLVPHLGVSTRQLLQTLGHEWGRTCVRPDVWTTIWTAAADRYLASGIGVIADDVRTPDEAEAITSRGGSIWRITRPGIEVKHPHPSEGSLNDFPGFAAEIANDGDLLHLENLVLSSLHSPL